jgi:hypothetical protein
VDYRKLNDVTVKNSYPLPRIDELQDNVQQAKWFTTLDIDEAYHQIRIKEGDEWKTAFRTKFGLYEYLVMPFGLTNAPATFQYLIESALHELIGVCCEVYLDDVLVYSENKEEHIQHVRQVVQKLKSKGLPIKAKKCEFFKKEVPFLGHIIGNGEIKMDQSKIQSLLDWPTPETVKHVQQFLGLGNYYRKFIYNYSCYYSHR